MVDEDLIAGFLADSDTMKSSTALGEVGDWEAEVAHPLGAGGLLVPDAVLHLPAQNLPHAFVELDRAHHVAGQDPLNPSWNSTTSDRPQRLAALINGRRERGA
ncbi:hypothetical protein [Streptomyces sp. NPDC005780]|uniref:hypothetical protein n=1 Tax=Streptomyces sp. NPDC005780 TaxID=3364730 RepID=UPI0036875BED